ncbi:MAG: HU family DNA-binding protein [Muribaculaceae bacterium]|nr:HU family DNA-binding protein [Muribaculaceae bacterium]
MDYKQFRKRLTELTGRDNADVDALVESLSIILRDSCADMDNVAIPTFGTFVPVKHKEEVRTDLSSGKRMLLPPEITLEFHPGGMLQKRLRNE